MELKDFVSETLIQIIKGVKVAQEQSKQYGAKINPTLTYVELGDFRTHMVTPTGNSTSPVFLVDFDVAITAVEGEGVKGGGGLSIAAMRIGAEAESTASNTQQSRVKFIVPITLPFEIGR
jgi:hypothetical protein